MKTQIIGILLLATTAAVGMDTAPSVSFAVADVKISTNRYPTARAEQVIKRVITHAEASACACDRLVSFNDGHANPFVQATFPAFAEHKGLVFSPDMIWLLIAQGFAEHVDKNAETLRSKLVTHSGKITLDVRRDDFVKGSADNPWDEVALDFSRQIAQHTEPELYSWLVPRFSTTHGIEQMAFNVTLMDAMGAYFSYDFWTLCGIPFVKLEGTLQDWEAILTRVGMLRQYGMDEWADELEPILQQFVDASRGKVDKQFWNSIFSADGGSGEVPHVTGWVITFFPHSPRHRNAGTPSINIDEFPRGIRKADFTWHYYREKYAMEFVSGFVGVYHDEIENSVRPVIGWAVREAQHNRDNLILGNPLDRTLIAFLLTMGLVGGLYWARKRRQAGRKLAVLCRISLAAIPLVILMSSWGYLLIKSGVESQALGYGSRESLYKLFVVTAIGLAFAQGVMTPVGVIAAVVSFFRHSRPRWLSVAAFIGNVGLLILWWILWESRFITTLIF